MRSMQLISKWLTEVLTHSTVIGRVWLTILFIFRVLLVMIVAEILWAGNLKSITCNTQQPGCEQVCHGMFYPIIPVHFWSAQILLVSTPTLLYLLYVMHAVYGDGVASKPIDRRAGVAVRKSVKCSCFVQLFAKIILEAAFIIAQYFLYGFVIDDHMSCRRDPCPSSVDCYISQATELSIISVYMLVVACVSVALNVLEGSLLLINMKKQKEECLDEGSEAYGLKQVTE